MYSFISWHKMKVADDGRLCLLSEIIVLRYQKELGDRCFSVFLITTLGFYNAFSISRLANALEM